MERLSEPLRPYNFIAALISAIVPLLKCPCQIWLRFFSIQFPQQLLFLSKICSLLLCVRTLCINYFLGLPYVLLVRAVHEKSGKFGINTRSHMVAFAQRQNFIGGI